MQSELLRLLERFGATESPTPFFGNALFYQGSAFLEILPPKFASAETNDTGVIRPHCCPLWGTPSESSHPEVDFAYLIYIACKSNSHISVIPGWLP